MRKNTIYTEENSSKCAESLKEVVILVHGTFSGAITDDGDLWWQKGSSFWEKLGQALPDKLTLLHNERLFHWSTDYNSKYKVWKGKNDQMYRHVASQELLRYLEQFEDKQIPYHVIAHSHGGLILWQALRIADFQQLASRKESIKSSPENGRQAVPLKYLRSCITLGTPYIRFEKLKKPKNTLLKVEFIALFVQFLFPLLLTVVAWFFVGFYALLALLSIFFLVPYVESKTFSTKFSYMQERDEDIAEHYAKNWLTIWSKDDEALNLLRGALALPGQDTQFTPTLPFVPPSEANWLIKVLFLNQHLLPFLFDKLVLPYFVRIAKNRFSAFVLGVNYFGGIQEISPWPCERIRHAKNLTEGIEKLLRSAADEQLTMSAPEFRDALTLFGSGKPIKEILAGLFGGRQGELIHTSYMENETVFRILVEHLTETAKGYK